MERLLSVDGGGVRGALPIRWLQRLEDGGRPVLERFDLAAGSSVGAAIVCGLGAGLRPDELEAWLREWADRIFPGGLWGTLRRTARLLGQPRYSARGLEAALDAAFGDLRLRDLGPRPILVTALSPARRSGRLFRSWRAGDRDLLVREVVRASTAAPTYLPAARVEGRVFLDGGMYANHPGPEAILEAWRGPEPVGLDRIALLGLGTGVPSAELGGDWGSRGVLEWAPDVVEAFMGAQSARSHHLCRGLLGCGYHRAQVAIPERLGGLDAAGNVPELFELADAALEGAAGQAIRAFSG